MRENLIDQYIMFHYAAKDVNALDKIVPHLENIYILIEETARIDGKEQKMLKLILGLLYHW